jgi:APA family basic amino acid/polyamine antiporter
MPAIFIFAYAFVALSIFLDKPNTALTGIAILSAFVVIYFIVKKTSKK